MKKLQVGDTAFYIKYTTFKEVKILKTGAWTDNFNYTVKGVFDKEPFQARRDTLHLTLQDAKKAILSAIKIIRLDGSFVSIAQIKNK